MAGLNGDALDLCSGSIVENDELTPWASFARSGLAEGAKGVVVRSGVFRGRCHGLSMAEMPGQDREMGVWIRKIGDPLRGSPEPWFQRL